MFRRTIFVLAKSRMIIEKLRKYILDCFQIGFVSFMWVFCETGIYEKLCFIFRICLIW